MGSNPSKQNNPGASTAKKSALKRPKPQGRQNQRSDLFGTQTFGPATTDVETGGTHHHVHYDTDTDTGGVTDNDRLVTDEDGLVTNRDGLVTNRDGMLINRDGHMVDRTNVRQNQPVNPWLGESTWPAYGNEPGTYRSNMAQNEPSQPRVTGPNPDQTTELYQRLPPQRPVRQPPTLRPQPSYNQLDQPYRQPGRYQGRRVQSQYQPHAHDQPPPYHTLHPLTYRRAVIPQQNPDNVVPLNNQNTAVPHGNQGVVIQQDPSSNQAEVVPAIPAPLPETGETSTQQGGQTNRNEADNDGASSYHSKYVVESLLSPEHTGKIQAMKITSVPVPKTETSLHEKDDDDYIGANLRFHRNQMKFRPNGETIDYMHKYWYGNYSLLEKNHNYIQWLFPTYESSRVNQESVPLRAHEAKHIHEDPEARERFRISFEMMLDFFGFRLADEETGQVERASNWKLRFANIRRSTHNSSRITRIIKSLGVLGESHLQAPFVIALFHEVFETRELFGISPASIQYWLRAINDDFEREYIYKQFNKGINRQEMERNALKGPDGGKYYFDRRKPKDNVVYTTRKKARY